MTRRYIFIALTLLLSIGVTFAREKNERILTPSEVLAHASSYEGKRITVRGYIVVGPESRNIFNSKKDYSDPKGACLGLDGPDKKFEKFHVGYSKVSGIFRQNLCSSNQICLYWCGDAGIELDVNSNP